MKIIVLTAMHARHDLMEIFATAMTRLRESFDIETCVALSSGDFENARICHEHGFHTVKTNNRPLSNKLNTGLQLLRDRDWTHVMILGSDDILSNRLIEVHTRHHDADFVAIHDLWFWGMNPKRAGYDTFTYWRAGSGRIGAGRLLSRRVIEALDYKLWPDRENGGLDGRSAKRIKDLDLDLKRVSYSLLEHNAFMVDIKYELNVSSLSPILSRGTAVSYDVIWDHLPGNECKALLQLRAKVKTENNL